MPPKEYVYWIDANLPPKTVLWLQETFGVSAIHLLSMNMLSTGDQDIFQKAKDSKDYVIIISKDEDFVDLVLRKKPPPKIMWITAGNISNEQLRKILLDNFAAAAEQLQNIDCYFIEIN